MNPKLGIDLFRGLAIACVLALVAAGAVLVATTQGNSRTVTAYFAQGVGVYPGGEVRVLGVPSGSIDEVVPEPKRVRVSMSVDADVPVAANPRAVVVAPSVVSDRYIQLDRYTGGSQLRDGTVIPFSRTQTPAELDDVYDSLNELAETLGPNGANKEGSLSRLLDTGAANLKGNGKALKDTITRLGEVTRTLNGKQGPLFDTVRNLASFSSALAASDADIREFNNRFADVSGFLAGEREQLARAVRALGPALGKVQRFVRDNQDVLKSNVDNLRSVTDVLVRERAALAEILDIGPLTIGNLGNAYNASSGTLDARAVLNELSDPPIVLLCKQLRQGTPNNLPQTLADACDDLAPIVNGLVPLPPVSEILAALQRGEVPALPKQGAGTIINSITGGAR